MSITETKVKFGYLSYDDMLLKIESGELNEYDIVYSRDRLLTYLISEDLTPIEIRSRVYVFNSVSEAESTLNNATDTYEGQVVAIYYKGKYRGYIVNFDSHGGVYVTPLWENPDTIDYDTLGNRPIINMVGTLDKPIIITTLSSGTYKIKGQYKIVESEETTYLSTDGDLFLIEDNHIKRITKDTINNYIINDNSIKKETYVTDEYLISKGYVTEDIIDSEIKALEESIKSNIQSYVDTVISEKIDTIIDERIDTKIDEKIQPISNGEVVNLF